MLLLLVRMELWRQFWQASATYDMANYLPVMLSRLIILWLQGYNLFILHVGIDTNREIIKIILVKIAPFMGLKIQF